MNKTYRSVWNEALGAWVAISELDGGRRKGARRAQRVRSLDRKDDSSGPVGLGGTARIAGLALAAMLVMGGAPEQASAQAYAAGGASANGSAATGVGINADASGTYSSAYGVNAKAWGTAATAVGVNAVASGNSSLAIGDAANVADDTGIAIGPGAKSVQVGSTAIGSSASSTGGDSVAIGTNAVSSARYATGIGPNSSASAEGAIAIGDSSKGQGTYSIALGSHAGSYGDKSTAVGINASAAGPSSVALGDSAGARNANDISVGVGATSSSDNSMALGTNAASSGTYSVGIGTNSSATATSAIAVGDSSKAHGASTSAFGSNAGAYADKSTAVGVSASAAGVSSVALGDSAGARNQNDISIGTGATSSSDNSMALGTNSASSGIYSMALGTNASSSGDSAVAAGANAVASGTWGVAVGAASKATAQGASAIGTSAQANGANSSAIGEYAAAHGYNSTAVGVNATAAAASSVALGDSSGARNQNDISIGTGATSSSDNSMALGTNSASSGIYSMALGTNASSSGDSAVAAGANAVASGTWAVAIGAASKATAQGASAVGTSAQADGTNSSAFGVSASAAAASSVALGDTAQATGSESLAIGHGAKATGTQSISVGTGNVVNGNNAGAFGDPNTVNGNGSYAFGNNNTIDADNAFVVGNNVTIAAGLDGAVGIGNNSTVAASTVASYNPGSGTLAGTATGSNVVSVGASGAERRITNVAAGGADTDAVNVSQLKSLASTVTAAGVVQRTGNTDETALTASGGSGATPGAAQKLTNLAAGTLSSTSTDAVNGSQLNATNQNVTTVASNTSNYLGGGADVVNGVAPTYTVQGGVYNNVGSALSAVDGNLTTLNNDVANVTNGTAGVVQRTSTTDETVLTAAGGTASAPGNAQKLTNLAAGTLSATSTDAVNGSQLYTTNTAIDNLSTTVAANKIKYFSVNSTATGPGSNADNDGATASQAIAIGESASADGNNSVALGAMATSSATASVAIGTNSTAAGEGSTAIGSTSTALGTSSMALGTLNTVVGDNSVGIGTVNVVEGKSSISIGNSNTVEADNAIVLGNNVSIAAGLDGAVGIGNNSTVAASTVASYNPGSGTLAGTATGSNVVSVGAAGSERRITNVAAGGADTDAVNVSQLKSLASNVTNLGSSAASVLGGNAAYDSSTGQLTTSNVGGTGQNTVDGAIASVNATAGKGFNLQANGDTATQVKPGDTVQLKDGQNIKVTRSGTDVTIATADDLVATSVTTGNSKLDTNGLAVNDGTNSTTYASTGMTIAGGPSVTTSGIDAGSKKITNVAAGTVSATSTDAVNGAQLNAVSTAANAGWNVTAQGANGTNVAPGASVDLKNSDGNVVVSKTTTSNDVTFDLAKNLTADSITTGNSKLDTNGLAITNGPSVLATGIDAGSMKITNAAAGTLSATSTDAVNGSQLYTTNTNVTNLTNQVSNGTVGPVQQTGTSNQLALVAPGSTGASPGAAQTLTNVAAGAVSSTSTDAVNGAQLNAVSTAANAGWNVTAQGANGTNVAPGASVDLKNSDGNVVVSKTTTSNDVTFDLAKNLTADSITTGNSKLDTNGLAITNGPSVLATGIDAGSMKITNVAAGTLSATSTDAVNGSQLYTTNTNVTNLTNQVSNGTVGPVQQTGTSNQLALVAPGSTGASPGAAQTLTNVAAGAVSSTSTDAVNGAQLNAVSTAANAGWNVTAQGANGTNVAPGASVDLKNSDGNVVVSKTTTSNDVTFDLAKNLTADSLTTGNSKLDTNGLAITNGPSVLATGIDAGSMKITNVAAGTLSATSTDAVNGSQLYTTNTNVTNLTNQVSNGTVGPVQQTGTSNQLALVAPGSTGASPGAAQTLTNVAAGALNATSTDAVNGSQLNATNQTVSTVASNTSTYLGGGADVANGVAPSYTVQGSNYNNVGGAIGAVDSSLTTLNSNVTNGTVGVVQRTSTTDETVLTAAGGTASAPGNAQKLTNLAAGTLSATSTDAVNGSQLYTTNQTVSTVASNTSTYLGGGADVATGTAPSYTVQGSSYNNVGGAIGAVDSSLTTLNNNVTNGTVGVVQRTSNTDETVLTAAGGTASAPGNAQKLTNLAAGTLSATSTDAVNGSQLNATNTNVTNLTNQVSNGTVGPVQQTGTSNQLALVAPGSTGASPGAAQTLTNVAAGALNATSTDAVNGSQLNATNQNVSTVASNTSAYLGGGADVAAGTAPSYTVQGSNYNNVGSALGAVDGNLTTLNTEVNNINNGGGIKYFHTNSTLADSQATGTDSTAIGPNAVASGLVSIAMGDGANATGSNSLALGPLAHATSAYSVAVGASANASAEGSVAMGNNASATFKNDVALGSSSTTSAVTPTTGATINGTAYTFAGTSPTSAVSVGAPGSERQIQNVAAGQLTASSTDAVNGSQLYSTNQAVTSLGQTVSTVASNTSTYLGGGADVAAGTAPSYTVQGSSYNNVGGAIGAVDSSLTTLNNNVTNGSVGVVQRTSTTDETVLTAAGGTASAPGNAQKLTNLAAGTLSATSTDAVNGAQLNAVSTAANAGWNVTAQGANGTNVAPGASVDLKNSDGNVVVSKTTTSNDVTFDLAKNLTADSLTTGNSKLDTNGLAITNGPSVLATGIDAGSMKITNVAAGTLSATSTDAVNGSQLYTTNTNVTNLTNQVSNGTVGPVQQTGTSNQLALVAPGSTGASPGAAQTLTNVAAGALNATSTDAVNGSQLNATNQTVSTVASNTSTYLGGGADVANGVAPSYTVQGSNYNNVGGAIGAVDSSLTTLNSNVTNGTVGVVQRTSTTDETVLTAAGGTASAPGNAQKLTNLAAGTLSATSTDAVNGSQLYTTNQTVSTVASNTSTYLGGGADVANGVAPSYTVQGSSYNNVGGAIGAVDSSLTTLNNNVTNGSVGVVQRSSTSDVTVLTAAGGTASAPGNAQKLTNLAAGTLSATSTDAVNGSQLYATNTAIDNLSTTVASNKTKYYSVNSTATGAGSNADNDGATGSQAIAAGESASASGNQAVAMGTQSAASGASGVALGSEAKASVDGGVALGAGSVSDRTVAGSQGTIAAGSNAVVSYNTTDRTLLGAVSVGSDTSYRQITNVADGTEQQDAVTVRQLTGALQSFAVSPTMYFHANSTATDSAAVGTDSVAIGPQTIVNGDNGIGMGNGATVQASATGGIAIGQASTSGATNAVALGSQASATAAQGVALGASSSVTQAGGVALGAGSVASTASGVAGYIPPTATSEQRTAIGATTSTLAAVSVGDAANGQYRQITGVAAGTVDSDAVNVSQLKAVQGQVTQIDQGTVKYDTKTDGSVDYNSVTMGGSNTTGAVTVHNVAEGVAGTDAVNVNQLNAGIDSAKQYADQRVNQLSNDVRKNAKQASAGTASAIAMANLPQAYVPGKSMVSVGAGGFDGEAGLALGVSKLSENSRWVMKFSATGNSRGKFGVGAGAGFTW